MNDAQKNQVERLTLNEKGLRGLERANATFLEFAGSTALAADVGVNFRISFLVGAAVTATIEIAKNKLGSE